ncbi:hypothetical protein FSARC_5652 [Fusarium sarcochroum]|uniref:Uncharacterized protein n=1 Tax=Fusarium sarcochroum TaxID=1208366 RepID=A0A8H4X988_9HYPO|nr:hypothetical protein FSARC_5652 [Fusarium sarcochroum]
MSHLIGYNLGALHKASKNLNEKVWSSYYPSADTMDENPVIPNPDTFSELDDLHEDNLPTPAQCAVHLELLEVFHALRIKIIDSKDIDNAFDLGEETKTVYRRKFVKGLRKYVNEAATVRNQRWEKKRDKKWTWYLGEAAQRFYVWATHYDRWMVSEMPKSDSDDGESGISMTDASWLPPVDILMIWHAFLLNPSDFLNYCKSQSWDYLPRVNFPWKFIHNAIFSQGPIRGTWVYTSNNGWEVPKGEPVIDGDLFEHLVQTGEDRTLDIDKIFGPIVNKLVDNVERQRVFVEKMNAHLWIRSPGLKGTLRRAVERYENYLQLFKLYLGKMLVPALDIDLAWHTSQLSAAVYQASMETRCGRFINHDDKIGKPKLVTGNDETQALYRIRFGQEYTVCLCWECQAIMSAVEESDRDGLLEESRSSSFSRDLANTLFADVEYHRAVEAARRRNHVKLPIRESAQKG